MRNLLGVTFLTVVTVSCGGVSGPPMPRLIPGGGVGDGAINGTLHVHVTDDDTREVVAAATVRVGESAATAPCQLTTDSTGLASFEPEGCPSLKGKVTVTVSATGYAPTTWIGVNGANLTIPIRSMARPAIETATATGTIAGWDDLPAPETGHQTLAIIGASQSPDLGDRANDLPQGMRDVTVGGVLTTPIPANVCVRNALADDCNWRLTTRTGPQAHFAIIVDQDDRGTPQDDTDDTFTAIAWAIKTGLTFSAGDTASGETLTMIADADMQPFNVSFASPPSGLDVIVGYPVLELGAEGRIAIISPLLDAAHTTSRVPKATGPLAGATLGLIAQARGAMDEEEPATLRWLRGVDASATTAVNNWLPSPSAITASSGMFSFAGVTGATIHGAELKTMAGERVWSVSIFDGSTSFTLPGLSPNPLPMGMMRLQASALQIPGVSLTNVSFDDARDKITGLSSDEIIFTN
jgi:hypothetical protein